jgi:hypothetical protein
VIVILWGAEVSVDDEDAEFKVDVAEVDGLVFCKEEEVVGEEFVVEADSDANEEEFGLEVSVKVDITSVLLLLPLLSELSAESSRLDLVVSAAASVPFVAVVGVTTTGVLALLCTTLLTSLFIDLTVSTPVTAVEIADTVAVALVCTTALIPPSIEFEDSVLVSVAPITASVMADIVVVGEVAPISVWNQPKSSD